MKKMHNLLIAALVFVFLGNIAAICIVIIQSRTSAADKDQIIQTSNENNENLKIQLLEIKEERKKLKIDLEERDKENKLLSEEILKLNRELIEKSDELNKFLGASDAYPILLVSSSKSNIGNPGFTLTIKNESEYPLYDVEIVVMDFNLILKNSTFKDGQYIIERKKFEESIILQKEENQITQNSAKITREFFHYPNGLLYIKLKCRNNFVFEKIAFVEFNNIIYHSFMVYDGKGNTLKEWFSEDTPDDIKNKLKQKFDLIPDSVTLSFID